MSPHPSTTKFIKTGRSKNPFLLFFGNRKGHQSNFDGPLPSFFTGLLLGLVVVAVAVCLYAFITGKLG
jgi:hypothetical protein